VLKAHSRLFEHLMLAGDLLVVAASWLCAYWLRFYVIGPALVTPEVPPLRHYLVHLVPILVVWAFAFRWFGLYRPRRIGSHLSEWTDIAKASTLGVLVVVAIMQFAFHGHDYSRVVTLYFLALSIVGASLLRAGFREVLRVARRHGFNLRRAVVVGGGRPAADVLAMLARRVDLGIQVIGVLADKADADTLRGPRLGGFEDVRAILDHHQVDVVFVALPHAEHGRLAGILADIGDDPVAIHLVPDVYGLASLRGGVEEFEAIPFIHLRQSPLHGWNLVFKRAFDIGVGGAALVAAAPVMLAIALAVRVGSHGPALLRQERMGLDGRRFELLKFRTMRADAEADTGPVWARPDDARRTALGALLRRFNLDELPQLLNVLRGEMSLVGPRPERPVFVEEFRRRIPGYMLRHKVKAGMTGWAQVNGWRGDTSLEKRIEYDLFYIERWSLLFDVKILVMTLYRGFTNAY
jgi:Undecaprenyl-phosphate glucose phosphotransferase